MDRDLIYIEPIKVKISYGIKHEHRNQLKSIVGSRLFSRFQMTVNPYPDSLAYKYSRFSLSHDLSTIDKF